MNQGLSLTVAGGFRFGMADNTRDVSMLGPMLPNVWALTAALGWTVRSMGVSLSLSLVG
jgi:hypothetical protein